VESWGLAGRDLLTFVYDGISSICIAKVKLSVSFGERWDETTELCTYNLPTHHYLESWGDAEAKTGITSFIQPTIYPLFKTRPYQTSLLRWSGNIPTNGGTDYDSYFKTYWTTTRALSEDAFNKHCRKEY
jgi:molybdopterin-containing oxidoreductase family iron-sulfur binding subunit